MKQMWKRLRSRSGESLGETLVALLVATLALMLLAGMISAATRITLKSKSDFAVYTNGENAIVEQNVASGTVSVKSSVNLIDDTDTFPVEYYKNAKNDKVVSYKVKP